MDWKLEITFTSGATETMYAVTRDEARLRAKILRAWPEVVSAIVRRA